MKQIEARNIKDFEAKLKAKSRFAVVTFSCFMVQFVFVRVCLTDQPCCDTLQLLLTLYLGPLVLTHTNTHT